MATRSVPRRKATPSIPAKPKLRTPDPDPATPAERMHFILSMYRDGAHSLPRNPLVADKTPQEALKACFDLVQSMYADSVFSERDAGKRYVHLMLLQALGSIEIQLADLFACAQQVASTHAPAPEARS